MKKEIFCGAGLRDIAGWLNETAREKLTSKEVREYLSHRASLSRRLHAIDRISFSLFLSCSLSISHCTPLNDVFHLISKNATGANARWESNIGMHHVSLRSR